MLVNLLVCGKFHYFNYISSLFSNQIFGQFHYSHAIGSHRQFLKSNCSPVNHFSKEYLVKLHLRLISHRMEESLFPLYESIWRNSVKRTWRDCDVCHFLANGTAVEVLEAFSPKVILADAVNTHPRWRLELIRDEAKFRQLDTSKYVMLDRHLRLEREVELSTALLVPTEMVRLSFEQKGYKGKIYKLPYCANLDRFTCRDFDWKPKLRILSVGRIGLRKGQLYLLEALKALHHHFDLTLVGPIDDEIKDLVGQMGVPFRHLPAVPSADMPSLMRAHDIYVAASLEEGLSVSIAEAIASGLFIVCTNESGGGELIENDCGGLLIPSRSADSIRESLIRILDSGREFIESVAIAGLSRLSANHSWDGYSNSLQEVYISLDENSKKLGICP